VNSLRRQLFVSLLALYVAAAAVAMFISYRQYSVSIRAFMDGQMHATANGYAQQIAATGKPPHLDKLDSEHVQHRGTLAVQIWSQDGRLLAGSYPIPGLRLAETPGFHDLTGGSGRWRIFSVATPPFELQLAQSDDFRQRVVWDSAWKSVTSIAVLIPLSGLLLWLVVFLAMRPVERLGRSIARQDERSLETLSTTHIPREIVPLVTAMNGLIVRLHYAFESQRRFVQDAAHELRTPLAACILQAESLRPQVDSGDDAVARLQAGLQRMRRLVDQLLRLAREEAAPGDGAQRADIRQVIRECVAELMPLAEQCGVDVGIARSMEENIEVDAGTMRTILDNVVENAIRHSPPGAQVDIAIERVGGSMRIEVMDSGSGIPPELLERVFDRFYRVPGPAREGTGIGLAIAQAAARRGGWGITLYNREGAGLCARITVPLG
jgi:two-component system OmpR family sensor kinase/two-component system sensor histidine kinase QseC